jgi:hypothetical protein
MSSDGIWSWPPSSMDAGEGRDPVTNRHRPSTPVEAPTRHSATTPKGT